MNWALIFGGIAVFAGLLAIGLTIMLWHKLTDLWSEFRMLSQRADELNALLESVDMTPLAKSPSSDV